MQSCLRLLKSPRVDRQRNHGCRNDKVRISFSDLELAERAPDWILWPGGLDCGIGTAI